MIVTTWQADWVWMQVDYHRHFPLELSPPLHSTVLSLPPPPVSQEGEGGYLPVHCGFLRLFLGLHDRLLSFQGHPPLSSLCLSFLHSWAFFLCSIQASKSWHEHFPRLAAASLSSLWSTSLCPVFISSLSLTQSNAISVHLTVLGPSTNPLTRCEKQESCSVLVLLGPCCTLSMAGQWRALHLFSLCHPWHLLTFLHLHFIGNTFLPIPSMSIYSNI